MPKGPRQRSLDHAELKHKMGHKLILSQNLVKIPHIKCIGTRHWGRLTFVRLSILSGNVLACAMRRMHRVQATQNVLRALKWLSGLLCADVPLRNCSLTVQFSDPHVLPGEIAIKNEVLCSLCPKVVSFKILKVLHAFAVFLHVVC